MSKFRLKPCPFCGGDADFDGEEGGHCAVCVKCGARTRNCETPREARYAWNLRPFNRRNGIGETDCSRYWKHTD